MGKTIIKAAKKIFISVKICRSYSDLNFGVTFLEHSVLVTNRKSHTGFRLIPTSMTSMTLNDLEWRNNAYFAFFFTEFIALLANYVTVVEDRPIMSVNIVSQF